MIERQEKIPNFRLKGTIIDIETTGGINFQHSPSDERYYENLRPTIFGYLTGEELVQFCAESEKEVNELIEIMSKIQLADPLYALNIRFERNIFIKYCQRGLWMTDVRFGMRGSKWSIREQLGIVTYEDPFNGDSAKCDSSWLIGEFDDCLKHNRACLCIERDILYNRLLPDNL